MNLPFSKSYLTFSGETGLKFTKIHIRDTQLEDLEGIFRIYDYEVKLNSTATNDNDTVPKTIEERVAWFHMSNHKYPILVAEGTLENGNSICNNSKTEIISWASLYKWSPRLAYSRTSYCRVCRLR